MLDSRGVLMAMTHTQVFSNEGNHHLTRPERYRRALGKSVAGTSPHLALFLSTHLALFLSTVKDTFFLTRQWRS
jgi:hypothetical protein